jgi:hypothetical protein
VFGPSTAIRNSWVRSESIGARRLSSNVEVGWRTTALCDSATSSSARVRRSSPTPAISSSALRPSSCQSPPRRPSSQRRVVTRPLRRFAPILAVQGHFLALVTAYHLRKSGLTVAAAGRHKLCCTYRGFHANESSERSTYASRTGDSRRGTYASLLAPDRAERAVARGRGMQDPHPRRGLDSLSQPSR